MTTCVCAIVDTYFHFTLIDNLRVDVGQGGGEIGEGCNNVNINIF